MFASKDLFFSKPSGYQISRSVRTRSSASGNFTRTPASATNRTVWTWSGWVKRGSLPGTWQVLLSSWVDGNNVSAIGFNASNQLEIYNFVGATYTSRLITNAVYRDSSAWYHVVVSSNGSSALNLYVNGVQVTSFATTVGPAATNWFFNSTNLHQLGTTTAGGVAYYLDGYLTEVNFIDGQALTPSSFGQTNTITGVWQPLKYTGTYGTNGFYLNFSDNSAATATTIGKDYSGNGNNWTPNNISVTAGVTYDSMLDVPTLFADGGNGRGNYCTFNPTIQRWGVPNTTFSNANLSITTTAASGAFGFGTMFMSTGKWYWEGTLTAAGTATPGTGLADNQVQSGTFTNLIEYNKDGSRTGGASWATYTTNDVIGVAMDCDNLLVYFYKNNTLQGSIALTSGVAYAPLMDVVLNASWAANFGQRPFAYTPPTGFVALNTQNLPTPTISNGANYMAATLYTSTVSGGNKTISGGAFQPDFVWAKDRSAASSNQLFDSVRGATKTIYSNLTDAEVTDATGLISFNSDGFTLGTNGGINYQIASRSYVGWQWKAGTTSSSNTAGSITSTVSVGATQGFSVLTFTGTGAVGTIGHGLGVAPSMIIVKNRPTAGTSWVTYHASVGATKYLLLNATDAATVGSAQWNNTAPTSTVFTMGNTSANTSGQSSVAYCFSEVAGYSKFGSYTGNGSADGAFVFCGFRPRYVLLKRSDTADAWVVFDSVRGTYNLTSPHLQPHLSSAEADAPPYGLDFLSNGFKCRSSTASMNASGGTYIFMAFAEVPLKFSLGR